MTDLWPNVTTAYDIGTLYRPEAFDFADLLAHLDHVAKPDMDAPLPPTGR